MTSEIVHKPEHRLILARHQEAVPVNIKAIADDLGLKVHHTRDWSDDVSGQIVRSDRHGGSSGYAIFLNRRHSPNRKRFTLAHEIAHFLLHPQFIGDGIQHDGLYRSGLSTPLEVQANKMAAEILMPKTQLLWAFHEGVNDVGDLAKRFRVSRAAMAIRLGIPTALDKASREWALEELKKSVRFQMEVSREYREVLRWEFVFPDSPEQQGDRDALALGEGRALLGFPS
ncbi:MAG: ImmA/IrrE family metallo-endopeptidase [Bryobacterales bacterium]|nr:ImmA/IrrE family metallo-endopeptidase [Bryobacterales bacterium]